MNLTQEMSKVEVKGFEAKFYDRFMDIITFGYYPFFIRKAIKNLNLQKGQRILDFGAGTGRNALLMYRYVGDEGEIVGLEIGKEMQEQFLRNCNAYQNIKLENLRIDSPLPFKEEFDVVFISFVLHGFIQDKRDIIIQNAYNALKPHGTFAILDYANFDVDKAPWYVRFPIQKVECPLAQDFIERDTKKMLESFGFGDFEESFSFGGYVRLLKAKKWK
ncbi:demethylmenaquinone methyltransferase / 2-methoxy-6-polyprenyl-1,4-benzoquinol methylase [Nitratiruptor sp. YY08-26]|uniref:class I SAM-dependent methyltransferase n=1 Tax=unclassified Nitratiruptor TaxID=2624044 RepID=UPI001915AB04|nr:MULTISPECIES: class I SAM-dependent methyltransferase [unclassified Nitratiruptor]BCD61308.1 demethylmenaquinone methyltransferase / 2-methoxy-6-polyprenyl-1,4-benzoquinol methylase [Nitratiruptor sp. YY08-13]BCD65241.1 demethylmenaquinone methyltransferase / 2-methoxy-6-polyprenyl-1,4-benzoquinol methylase [Nitratiruptor sp. YY08-26]